MLPDSRAATEVVRASRAHVWGAGLRIGLSTLPAEPLLGLKRLALPVGYWRTAEFAYAISHLPAVSGSCLLDLGSPKDLAAMLARQRGNEVVATDILREPVALSNRYAEAQGLVKKPAPGAVRPALVDGRQLAFKDGTFDAAFSISVLEHVPEGGDSIAIHEMIRVVKPGGRVVVTVPYSLVYRETFVEGNVYERQRVGDESVFFERHYDALSLRDRLFDPSGGEVIDLEVWGEKRIRVERALSRTRPASLCLSPFEPFLACLFLHHLQADGGRGTPMAAFFTLRKPEHGA